MKNAYKAKIIDITLDEQGQPRLSKELLKTIHEESASISDTETTGLNRKRNGLTEFASIRVDKVPTHPSGQPYRLKLLNTFILPMKPAYQDYLEAKERGENIPYVRSLYEYNIDLRALEVTGTKLLRPDPAGPITGMEVNGKRVDAHPFYEVAEDITNFIRPHDLYYNAPFDKPMIAEKLRDLYAWRAIKNDEHLTQFLGLGNTGDIPFAELTPSQREMVAEKLRSSVTLPESLTNPAQWQCLLHAYLLSEGQGPSNRLDDAYRKLVDPSFTERADHSAVEDITMAAKVAGALHDKLGNFPSMAGVYEKILKRADPDFIVTAGKQRQAVSKTMRDFPVEGDIEINFPAAREQLSERARKYWDFFAEFAEALKRNSRVPPYILSLDEKQHKITLSAERAQPMMLGMLRKFMYYEEMLDSGLFDKLKLFDSTGNRVDVVLKGTQSEEERTVHDLPLGSLRKNLPYLRNHPETLRENLQVMHDLREHDRKVGLVIFEDGKPGQGDRITIKGHLRAFGDVTFVLPKGKRPAECTDMIREQLDFMIKIGAIPEVAGAMNDALPQDEMDSDLTSPADSPSTHADVPSQIDSQPAMMNSRVILGQQNTIRLSVTPKLMALIMRGRGLNDVAKPGGKGWQPKKLGNLRVTANKNGDGEIIGYALEGEKLAFHDVFDLHKIENDNTSLVLGQDGSRTITSTESGGGNTTIEHKTDKAAEPVGSLLRNASWLAYRLDRIPGTHSSEIRDGHIFLKHDDGISPEAIHVLRQARIPCNVNLNGIDVDTDYLMQDAFHWSQQIGRAMQDLKDNSDKSLDKREPIPAAEQALYMALLAQTVKHADLDNLAHIWLTDGRTWVDGRPRRYRLDAGKHVVIAGEPQNGLAISESSLRGPYKHTKETSKEDEILIKGHEPFLKAITIAMGQPTGCTITHGIDDQVLHIPSTLSGQLSQVLPHVAELFHALSYVHGANRQDMRDISLSDDGKIRLHAPLISIAEDTTYLADLTRLHTTLTDTGLRKSLDGLRRYFPEFSSFDRRAPHITMPALADMLHQAEPLVTSVNANLNTLLAALQTCNFTEKAQKELGSASMLLHESKSIGEQITEADTVRNELGTTHTALLRLDEAARMVEKKIFNDHGDNLRRTLADAQLYNIDLHLQKAMKKENGEAETDEANIEARIKNYESILTHLASNAGMDTAAKLKRAYWEKSQSYLQALPDHPEWADITKRLLRRAYPKHTDDEINSRVELYLNAKNPEWMANADNNLFEMFPSLDRKKIGKMARECKFLTDSEHQENALADFNRDIERDIDKRIVSAYQTHANQYLYLLVDHPQYESQVRELLEKTGVEDEVIDRKIKNASKKWYSDSYRERARSIINSPIEGSSVSELLQYISPDNEERAKTLLREKLHAEYEKEASDINKLRPTPYAELKLRRRVINAVTALVDEIEDLQLVQFHAIRDVATARACLATDKDQRTTLDHQFNSTSIDPAAVGLKGDTFPKAHEARHRMQASWAHNAERLLKSLDVPEVEREGVSVIFDGNSLLRDPAYWVGKFTGEPVIAREQNNTPPPAIYASSANEIIAGLRQLVSKISVIRSADPLFDVSVALNLDSTSPDAAIKRVLEVASQDITMHMEQLGDSRIRLHAPATGLLALLEHVPTPDLTQGSQQPTSARRGKKPFQLPQVLNRTTEEGGYIERLIGEGPKAVTLPPLADAKEPAPHATKLGKKRGIGRAIRFLLDAENAGGATEPDDAGKDDNNKTQRG